MQAAQNVAVATTDLENLLAGGDDELQIAQQEIVVVAVPAAEGIPVAGKPVIGFLNLILARHRCGLLLLERQILLSR